MLFNSIDFAVFLPIVFVLYWFVTNRNLKLQNLLIVGASYVFYGWWDWRFLSLILFSTLVDYTIGRQLKAENNQTKRKVLLWTSILINLGFLGFFKYYNFFLDNFISAFSIFGMEINANSLNIILPVGISFYTFQTLSYTIDVYKRKLEPTKDFIAFSAFVSFFPQLVAGPIERAKVLLPQFFDKRKFDYSNAVMGMRQILLGLVKKMVIADNCAIHANAIFENYSSLSASVLVLGAVCFAIQIYGDFSGYSDIALGTARLFGFRLMTNFRTPYLSRNIAEFWRRWHISLSTWFRDYLYIPLGGSKGGKNKAIRNTFIIFLVSGFWHGANWTFIIWGLIHALAFVPLLVFNQNRKYLDKIDENKYVPSLKNLPSILITFSLVCIGWVFFRAPNITIAISYIENLFSMSLFTFPNQNRTAFIYILFMFCIDWFTREGAPKYYFNNFKVVRWTIYTGSLILLFFYSTQSQSFIYFQF